MNAFTFKPYCNTSVAIGLLSFKLTLSYQFGKLKILCGLIHTLYKVIIATSGNIK